jgi:hypothetical protein
MDPLIQGKRASALLYQYMAFYKVKAILYALLIFRTLSQPLDELKLLLTTLINHNSTEFVYDLLFLFVQSF